MGRPPRDPSSAPAGTAAYHLGLRFNAYREAQLRRLVDAANERARAVQVPVNVTASSLVHAWIVERIEAEIAKLDAAEKKRR